MPPSKNTSQEASIIVALMEQIDALRKDVRDESEKTRTEIHSHRETTSREFRELRDDMSDMRERLAGGSERIKNMRRDIDSQKAKCEVHGTTALQRKLDPAEAPTRVVKKSSMPWWLPLLAGGALAWGGERLAKFVINGIADPPPATTIKP